MAYIVNDKIINGKDIKSSFYLFYLIPFIVPLSLILLQIVMVSPGTHLVKNHESQSRTNES